MADKPPPTTLRNLGALILGALVSSAFVAIFITALVFAGLQSDADRFTTAALAGASAFTMAAMLAVPSALIVGPVAYAWRVKRGSHELSRYLAAGLAGWLVITICLLFAALLIPPDVTPLFGSLGASSLFYGLPMGPLTAAIAWCLRRPDLDNPAVPSSQT